MECLPITTKLSLFLSLSTALFIIAHHLCSCLIGLHSHYSALQQAEAVNDVQCIPFPALCPDARHDRQLHLPVVASHRYSDEIKGSLVRLLFALLCCMHQNEVNGHSGTQQIIIPSLLTQASATWDKFRKERDFHRMHHKRVAQEKNKLIQDMQILKKHYSMVTSAQGLLHHLLKSLIDIHLSAGTLRLAGPSCTFFFCHSRHLVACLLFQMTFRFVRRHPVSVQLLLGCSFEPAVSQQDLP